MSGEASENGNDGPVSALPARQEGLFDLRNLARELWRWKWIVLLAGSIGAAKGISNVHDFSPRYEAQMIVAPIADQGFPAKGGASLLGVARSFGIVSAGTVSATSFDYFRQVLGSRGLADVLQRKHGLMQKVFKGSWDEANQSWIKPQIDEDSIRQRLRRFFHFNPHQIPDRGRLAKYVGAAVKVQPLSKTPFFKISVVHSDPDFALFLLKNVYLEADGLLAARSRIKQARDKKYINAQIEKAQLTEVRTALLSVLMNMERRAMLANSEPPYMVKVLESPWVATQPDEPQLGRIIGIPVGVALILSLSALTLFISFRIE